MVLCTEIELEIVTLEDAPVPASLFSFHFFSFVTAQSSTLSLVTPPNQCLQ